MGEQQVAFRPLSELLGHERQHCRIPGRAETEGQIWAKNEFKAIVDSLPEDLKENLVFLDVLFSRVDDPEQLFFGGIATRRGLFEDYRVLLETLLRTLKRSTGSHVDFGRGLVSDAGQERWLRWTDDSGQGPGPQVGNGTPTEHTFDIDYLDARTLLGSVTADELVEETNHYTVIENWDLLIANLKTRLPVVQYVGGVPLTVPPSASTDGFHVGSLFAGFDDPRAGSSWLPDLVLRVFAFALRSFSLQKAAQAARFQESQAKRMLLERILPDVESILAQISGAQQTARKVEAVLSVASEAFLSHGEAVGRIFLSKNLESHYLYKDAEFQFLPNWERPTRLQQQTAEAEGWSVGTFTSAHISGSCSPDAWVKGFAPFLRRYGEAMNVPLIQGIGEMYGRWTDTNPKPGNEIAQKCHALAKISLYRPHASPARIFDLQFVVAALAALNGRSKVVLVQKEKELFKAADLAALWQVAAGCSNELLTCDDGKAGRLPDDVRCAEVLGAFMRFVGSELVENKIRVAQDSVTVRQVAVHAAPDHIEVVVECNGKFSDIRVCLLKEGVTHHSLGACLRVLCDAIEQPNVALAVDAELQTLRELAEKSRSARFVVGQSTSTTGGGQQEKHETKFLLRVNRCSPMN
jgi:hypothetical protein